MNFSYFLILFLFVMPICSHAATKEPNVAGTFYTSNAQELATQIESFLQQASSPASHPNIQALIVPHAGYQYSGPIAAYGYKAISKHAYSTIVILAPSHYFPFNGISIWPEGAFKTPLGVISVDKEFASKLLKADSEFKNMPEVFEKEHALEVQLPFIQKTFGKVKIVPVLMGNPNPQVSLKLAATLNELIGSRQDILVLASSDMSHYHDYEAANKMDEGTLEVLVAQDIEKFWNGCFVGKKMEMCGAVPVATLLIYAKTRGLTAKVLKYANSGDTAGDKSRVVGYSSVMFYKEKPGSELNASQKQSLLALARETLDQFVKIGKTTDLKSSDPSLLQTQGAFVTLHKNGQLRGCIGHIIGDKPLWDTVKDMTIAAASQDPRFPPVTVEELKSIHIEISALSVPVRVPDASSIELGRDGVILSDNGAHQGLFLPQVATETQWSKEKFLSELCSQKAGLPADCWKNPKNSLWTFQADVFSEN